MPRFGAEVGGCFGRLMFGCFPVERGTKRGTSPLDCRLPSRLAGCSPLWAAEDPSAADSGEAGAFVRVGSAVSSRRWRVSRPQMYGPTTKRRPQPEAWHVL